MNSGTTEYIRAVLLRNMQEKKSYMMTAIDNVLDDIRTKERIEEYREANNALNDFDEWLVEQEDTDVH